MSIGRISFSRTRHRGPTFARRRFASDWPWLTPLLVTDAAFVFVFLAAGVLVVRGVIPDIPYLLNIARDWSLPEIFTYLKWVALTATLTTLYLRSRHLLFLALAILCAIALIDDSLQLHENLGWKLASLLGLPLEQNYAMQEMLVFGVLGLLVIGPLIAGWLQADRSLRRVAGPLLALLGGVAFCAVVIDAVHTALPDRSIIGGLFGALEDGGEMMLLSAALSYSLGRFIQYR